MNRVGVRISAVLAALAVAVIGGGAVAAAYESEQVPWAAAGVNDPAGTTGTNHNESLLAGKD